MDALENVEPVVETAVVELVEDLHPDEGVEDDGVEFEAARWVGGYVVVVEDGGAGKVQEEADG